jgi:hypothetical protein
LRLIIPGVEDTKTKNTTAPFSCPEITKMYIKWTKSSCHDSPRVGRLRTGNEKQFELRKRAYMEVPEESTKEQRTGRVTGRHGKSDRVEFSAILHSNSCHAYLRKYLI